MQKVHERQHKWLEHALRMVKYRIANTALNGREGTTKTERPNTTLLKSTWAIYEIDPQVLMETTQKRN